MQWSSKKYIGNILSKDSRDEVTFALSCVVNLWNVSYFDILWPAVILSMNVNYLESNEVLKLKFRKLQTRIVKCINPPSIMDFLFQEEVIGSDDMRQLQKLKDDPQQQCRDLLVMLHESEHPQAFIQLYAAIKQESHLKWLIDLIDKDTDQSLTDQLQQVDIAKTTGEQGALGRPAGRKFKKIFSIANPSKPWNIYNALSKCRGMYPDFFQMVNIIPLCLSVIPFSFISSLSLSILFPFFSLLFASRSSPYRAPVDKHLRYHPRNFWYLAHSFIHSLFVSLFVKSDAGQTDDRQQTDAAIKTEVSHCKCANLIIQNCR